MDQLTVSGYSRRPPHVVADEKGFFTKEGLDVNFHLVRLAPLHNDEMAAGKWEMTLSSADTMIARSTKEGVDYVLFMQAEEGLGAYLIGQPGINSVEDLRGKLLAADPVDSNLDIIRMKIMREHGIGEDEYSYEIIGSTPSRAKALQEGKVAAAMLTPPSSDRVLAEGGVLLASGEDYVPDWPLACGWGLRSWVEGNRDLVVRFIRAWSASTDWLLAPENHAETIRLLTDLEGLSRERAEHAYNRVVPKGRISPEAIRKNLELRIELGVYPPPHSSAEDFYDTSYWCEATGEPVPEIGGMPANAA
ncbi:MAG: ABC transporter substrate-binding protein [Alphaproteobacteria bacterium]|nr:ABC transporter substrate-binding protein [Alphaproteobacteria bacterium]